MWFDTVFRGLQTGSPRTGGLGARKRPVRNRPLHPDRMRAAEDWFGGLGATDLCGSTRAGGYTGLPHHERGEEGVS